MFNNLQNIKKIELNNNRLQKITLTAFVDNQYLEILNLASNNLSFIKNEGKADILTTSPFQPLKNLRILNLENNQISKFINDWKFILSHLNILNLSYNKIANLNWSDLQFSSKDIEINLSHNNIGTINFEQVRTHMNTNENNKINVILNENPIQCDCNLLDFIQFVHNDFGKYFTNFSIIHNKLNCIAPAAMQNRPVKNITSIDLVCGFYSDEGCPNDCRCFKRTIDKTMIINCSNANMSQVPSLPHPNEFNSIILHMENNRLLSMPYVNSTASLGYDFIREIFVQNNNITQLLSANIPSNLTTLNLENNQINSLDYEIINKLKNTNLTNLYLAHNPWSCECKALDLFSYIENNKVIVHNIQDIECLNGQMPSDFVDSHQCFQWTILQIMLIICPLIGIFVLLITLLVFIYQEEIQIWLFAHNLCSCWINEFDIDKNKKYDAFISYSNEDIDFIINQLKPKLENSKPSLKLCLHERDWLVGGSIAQSVCYFWSFRLILLL